MLRDDAAGVRPTVALVAPTLCRLDEVGAFFRRHAAALAEAGRRVVVLVADDGDALEEPGVECVPLASLTLPAEANVEGPNQTPALRRSDRVLEALLQLHERHAFDWVEFPDRGGLGFRAVQARRAGLGFPSTPLVVRRFGLTADLRHEARQWPDAPAALADDYAERYALDHADAAPSPDEVPHFREPKLSPTTTPLVTVSIAHYNLGAYLPETLASLARQTYAALEVHVHDDGSTEAESRAVFARLEAEYPRFRFFRHANAGIGATRNRGLAAAQGDYFLPMDADNLARPDMVERFVAAAQRSPGVAAWSCHFLAFRTTEESRAGRFAYAYRPTGGPRVLGALLNVYGDGNALFHADTLRAGGGFEIDRGTSWEDWEVFAKLAARGHAIDVVPRPLFEYRHRDAGFSRTTDSYRNHQRVLRQYLADAPLSAGDRHLLWNALAGFQHRLTSLEDENLGLKRRLAARRYRWLDRAVALLRKVPLAQRLLRRGR